MYKHMKIHNYENMKIQKHIWKYTNVHGEKYKCEKCKRVCKESKYIYTNVNKEPNKRDKEKINKNKKYIEMCNVCRKYLCENLKRYIKNRKHKNMYNV